MPEMKSCGHHFRPNGDLELYFSRPSHGLILALVWGFRDGVKVLVDSWCEPRCPECGCPSDRYHATRCRRKEPHA